MKTGVGLTVALLLLATLAVGVPSAAAAGPYPEETGEMKLNLQAEDVVVQLPARFQEGTPDAWGVEVLLHKGYADYDQSGKTAQSMGKVTGTGALPTPVKVPVDSQWRWRLITESTVVVDLKWAWTKDGQSFAEEHSNLSLTMYTNKGPSSGGMPGFGDFHPIYRGENHLLPAPGTWLTSLGHAVSDHYDKSSFLSGGELRSSLKLPWIIPWDGGPRVRVRVIYPEGKNPGTGIKIYKGTVKPPDKPGATVQATVRLTDRGRELARSRGAGEVAMKVGNQGIVDYYRDPVRTKDPQLIWVPVGTWFHDYQVPKENPRAQTCKPFPGIPNGYLMYTTIDSVYGSDTCRKGDPLTPIPLF